METQMAADDRNFEKALARHLRSEMAAAQPANCADAETLAAYQERLLAPHELSAWKEHIAGCARCQEILAQLEATDAIPVAMTAEQEVDKRVIVMPGRESALMSAAPTATTTQSVPARAAAGSAGKPRRSPFAHWRYVVPAGAIAAGLLVFIVSREDNLQKNILQSKAVPANPQPSAYSTAGSPDTNAKLDAENERAKAPLESKAARIVPPLSAPTPVDELSQAQGGFTKEKAARVDQLERDQRASDLRKEETLKDAQRGRYAAGHADRALQQQSNNAIQQEPSLDELRKQPAKSSADLKQDAPAFDDSDKLATPPPAPRSRALAKPAAPAPAPAPPPAPPGSVPGDVVGGIAGKKAKVRDQASAESAELSAAAAERQTVVVTGESSALIAASMAQIGGPRVLPVPGTRIIWKIDEAGHVQRTSDLGTTWKVQDTGVNATLLSGSAPSEKVCWLVGTFGTVLLTMDSGAHWSKLSLPINSTIDRIEASDARHAVVTLQSSTVQFETFDGGQTWSLVKKK
jgi:hypothetical protein